MTRSTRGYDAPSRRAGAERTRAAVLRAAAELLLRDGYQATTIRSVAERAGVSVETIYKAFGTKPRLVKAVYDVTLAGDDEPIAIGDRPARRTIWAAADPSQTIAQYATFVRELMQRLGGLLAVLTDLDPELAEVRATTEAGVGAFVAQLGERGQLRDGLDGTAATDGVWVLTSPMVYAQLTQARGWTPEQYEQWLAEMLAAALLPPTR